MRFREKAHRHDSIDWALFCLTLTDAEIKDKIGMIRQIIPPVAAQNVCFDCLLHLPFVSSFCVCRLILHLFSYLRLCISVAQLLSPIVSLSFLLCLFSVPPFSLLSALQNLCFFLVLLLLSKPSSFYLFAVVSLKGLCRMLFTRA